MVKVVVCSLVLLICSGTASAWLSGYDHRMAITVNNGGASTLNDYQFNFANDTNTLVAAGHMQTSGADCRITDASDNLIPFWNENAFNAAGTKIWANATTLTVGANTFYMYYGNVAAADVSSGANTFEFFDDFETDDQGGFLERYAGNPVVTHGGSGWDASSAREPDIVYHDNKYWMYYIGAEHENDPYPRKIGLATSTDGYTFTKEATNPVLEPSAGEWDKDHVGIPVILYHASKFWLYYAGKGTLPSIGLATSADGITFAKEATNPVLEKTGAGWESSWIRPADVIYHDSKFWLFYEGNNGSFSSIGVATSMDGITFTRHASNPVLEVDQAWEDTRVTGCRVFYYDGKWRMYYTGDSGYDSACGYAESDDLTNWTKHADNPVFECDSSIPWEVSYAFWLTFVFKEDNTNVPGLFYYVGKSEVTAHNQIGVANQTALGAFLPPAWTTVSGSPDYYSTTQAKSPTHSMECSNAATEGGGFSQTPSDDVAFECWVYIDSVTTQVFLVEHGDGTDNIKLAAMGNDIKYYINAGWQDTGVNIVLDAWKKVSIYDINWAAGTFKMEYDGNIANCNIRQGEPASIDSVTLRVNNAIAYYDDTRVRKHSSPEPTSSLGAEEDAPSSNDIIIAAYKYALLRKDVTASQTFTAIASGFSHDICYSWFSNGDAQWESYWDGDSYHSALSIPEHEAYFVLMDGTGETVSCGIAAAENVVIPVGWSTTYLRESTAKTLTAIKSDMGVNCDDLYAWDHTASNTGAWTNTGSYSVLPNQGLMVNSMSGFTWDGAVP